MGPFNDNTKKGTAIELSGGFAVRSECNEESTLVTLTFPDGKNVVIGAEHALIVADAILEVLDAVR